MASPLSAAIAVLVSTALASAVSAGGRDATPRHDGWVLAEIADDVLRPAPTSPDITLSEPVSRHAIADDEFAAGEGAVDPATPVTHNPPAREGTFVATPPGVAARAKPDTSADPAPAGYESNTWRQRPHAQRGLSFSSGG